MNRLIAFSFVTVRSAVVIAKEALDWLALWRDLSSQQWAPIVADAKRDVVWKEAA